MSKKSKIRCGGLVYLVLVLAFCLASPVDAADIIWVSDFYDDDGDGVTDDQGWVELLEAQGYTVDYTMDCRSQCCRPYYRKSLQRQR